MNIDVDLAGCETVLDVGYRLKAALHAPDWHGDSIDAFIDSMIWGGVNGLKPPYSINAINSETLPPDVVEWISLLKLHLSEQREYYRNQEGEDVDVVLRIMTRNEGAQI